MRIFSRKLLPQLLLKAGILALTLAPAMMHASCSLCPVNPMQRSYASDDTQISENSFPWSPQSFDWSAQPTYIIQGTLCTSISGVPNPVCDPVTFVIDPPNKRILFDLGHQGKFYILENETFITHVFPICLRVLKADGSNFTFADQVKGYLTAISMPDSKQNALHYFGLVSDVGSCKEKMGLELHLREKYLSQLIFSQRIPLPNFTGCLTTTGVIIFDQSTISKGPTDPFFNDLPTDCTDLAPDYCQAIYYSCNPCNPCNP